MIFLLSPSLFLTSSGVRSFLTWLLSDRLACPKLYAFQDLFLTFIVVSPKSSEIYLGVSLSSGVGA